MDKPKPASSGSSSDDLATARAMTQRLRGGAPAPTPPSSYVTFSAPEPRPAPRPSLPLMARRQPVPAPAASFGSDGWNTLLEAVCAAALGDAAFLMDPSGLIVAARGRGVDELEAVGARLMVAFDQADHIDGRGSTLSLSVETSRGTLFGLRLARPGEGFLTLGCMIPTGLTAERQARVVAIVSQAGER